MATSIETLTNHTVELLQQMIRNQCVNDGTIGSGHEDRTAQLLLGELEGTGVDIETITLAPGRTSVVARYQGTDPSAPSVCLMGHTDVVPVSPEGWRNDPFGGELITNDDGTPEVWGRGAVDMLNLTASMAVAFKEIITSGKRYPGDIIYFAVADEEAGGIQGAKPIVADYWDAVKCDYLLTEYGGTPSTGPNGTTVLLTTGEKQGAARRIVVHGTPGHGSMPYATDNAMVKAAKIVQRLAEYDATPKLDKMFADRVAALGFDDEAQRRLLDPALINDILAELPPGMARNLHSCSHMSFSPNLMHAGDKVNTVPSRAEIIVDIRILPGETQDDVDRVLNELIGPDLMPSVEIMHVFDEAPKTNPMSSTNTPMWDAMSDAIRIAYPDARVIPSLVTGGTDARFFRQRGVEAYGAGLLSTKVSLAEFMNRFHGHNERIDIESLQLTTKLWLDIMDRFWR